jgi:hypothetical protein
VARRQATEIGGVGWHGLDHTGWPRQEAVIARRLWPFYGCCRIVLLSGSRYSTENVPFARMRMSTSSSPAEPPSAVCFFGHSPGRCLSPRSVRSVFTSDTPCALYRSTDATHLLDAVTPLSDPRVYGRQGRSAKAPSADSGKSHARKDTSPALRDRLRPFGAT